MSLRRLLIDNDAFILLAATGYLQNGVELLGFNFNEVRRLSALEPMLRKPARSLSGFSADIRNRALEQCGRVPEITATPGDSSLELLGNVTGLDDGEAILYGLAAEHPCWFLASNDKRAMTAVATDLRLTRVRAAVAGKVICLEAVAKLLIQTQGATLVADRFRGAQILDRRLDSILSPAFSNRPEDCLPAVNSFLAGLDRQFGADFLFKPGTELQPPTPGPR
jgi:hypothetical protein